jgi:hypothetical protein
MDFLQETAQIILLPRISQSNSLLLQTQMKNSIKKLKFRVQGKKEGGQRSRIAAKENLIVSEDQQ